MPPFFLPTERPRRSKTYEADDSVDMQIPWAPLVCDGARQGCHQIRCHQLRNTEAVARAAPKRHALGCAPSRSDAPWPLQHLLWCSHLLVGRQGAREVTFLTAWDVHFVQTSSDGFAAQPASLVQKHKACRGSPIHEHADLTR